MLASLLLFFPALTRAETAVEAWVQRYNGPGNGSGISSDGAAAVTVDHSNNVIVTGFSTGSGISPNVYDYLTIQYSSAGVPIWTNRYSGSGNSDDRAAAVAVDGSNNVIVTGSSFGSGSSEDYATIKYSSAGVPLWTNRYNGPGNEVDYAKAVAVDGSNNVIVTGYSMGSGYSDDYATIKYSSAGVPLWTNRYNGPGNSSDLAYALAVDGSNNVIVTGYSMGSGSSYDYATIQYSSAGVPLWTNRYNGPGNSSDLAFAVAVDGSNNVIVTGYSLGGGSSYDYATIKYSSAGVPLWTNRYNGPGNYDDQACALVVDSNNNVIVTGYSYGSGSLDDYVTIKYSSAGVPLWTNRYNGPGNANDQAYAVAVDGSNNVIVTGSSTDIGQVVEYLTIKYSSAGVLLWTSRYHDPSNEAGTASAVAVDGSNNIIVTGSSGEDFVTVKYVSVWPPVMTDLKLINGTFQMQVENLSQFSTVLIEASTNLSGWSPLYTNSTPTNVLFYTDPNANNFLWRFYRASGQL
jgi:3-isopropylmalate dehydratase small subunit